MMANNEVETLLRVVPFFKDPKGRNMIGLILFYYPTVEHLFNLANSTKVLHFYLKHANSPESFKQLFLKAKSCLCCKDISNFKVIKDNLKKLVENVAKPLPPSSTSLPLQPSPPSSPSLLPQLSPPLPDNIKSNVAFPIDRVVSLYVVYENESLPVDQPSTSSYQAPSSSPLSLSKNPFVFANVVWSPAYVKLEKVVKMKTLLEGVSEGERVQWIKDNFVFEKVALNDGISATQGELEAQLGEMIPAMLAHRRGQDIKLKAVSRKELKEALPSLKTGKKQYIYMYDEHFEQLKNTKVSFLTNSTVTNPFLTTLKLDNAHGSLCRH